MKYASEDLTKLPQWAQRRISKLESDIEYWRERAAESLGLKFTPVQVRIAHDLVRSLPHDCKVIFHVKSGTVEAKITEDGEMVDISMLGIGGCSLWIRPRASNQVRIG